MEKQSVKTQARFFAAANGYSGFRSYFDQIFKSQEYERIYVIKGGPGTGKSSMMRRLERDLFDDGFETEAIFCSSDPSSLDGVIARKNGRIFAMLDGTAPHERDATMPGAIDSLVPLGEFWDARILRAEKERICELIREKSAAYKVAYSYLKIAGEADTAVRSIYNVAKNELTLKNAVKSLAESSIEFKRGAERVRLISAFGKGGYHRLSTLESLSERKIYIGGTIECATELIGALRDYFRSCGMEAIRLPSPFNDSITEAIYIPCCKTCFIADNSEECEINADELIKIDSADTERIKVARHLMCYALEEASRWFGIASDFHFRLEDIYRNAMNFEKLDGVYSDIHEEILKNI